MNKMPIGEFLNLVGPWVAMFVGLMLLVSKVPYNDEMSTRSNFTVQIIIGALGIILMLFGLNQIL